MPGVGEVCSVAWAVPFRLVLGITLVLASAGKLRNLPAFVAGVAQYQILPAPLARWYGRLLPFVELGTGALFLLGLWVQLAAVVAGVMLISFAVAVGANVARKREMPCYCFGADATDKMGWHTLARIGLLLGVAAVLAVAPSGQDPLQRVFRDPSIPGVVNLFPMVTLTVFGLFLLALLEKTPWVVRAWTAPAVRPARRGFSVVWSRVPESQVEAGENA